MNRTEIKQLIISNTPNINDYKLNMIKRYLSFITSCECKQNIPNSDITEKHHILPKSIFSIYKNLKIHKWNLAKLTLRQHFIAHLMLHFIFGGKMTYALYYMIPRTKKKYNLKNNIFISKLYKLSKSEFANTRKGFGCYKDQNNKIYFLHKDDKLIRELNLVGHQKGFKFNKDQINIMLNNRHNCRGIKIKVYFMKYKKLIFKDELNLYLSLGWNTLRNSDDQLDIAENIRINAINCGNATNEKYYKKGMKYYFYKDGSNYGFLYPNDPIINELNLSLDKHTDKMIEQRKKWLEASNKVIKGSKLYNNGINQILLKDNDIILDGYIKGGLSKYDIYLTNDFKNKLINLLIKYSGNLNKMSYDLDITNRDILTILYKFNIDYKTYYKHISVTSYIDLRITERPTHLPYDCANNINIEIVKQILIENEGHMLNASKQLNLSIIELKRICIDHHINWNYYLPLIERFKNDINVAYKLAHISVYELLDILNISKIPFIIKIFKSFNIEPNIGIDKDILSDLLKTSNKKKIYNDFNLDKRYLNFVIDYYDLK